MFHCKIYAGLSNNGGDKYMGTFSFNDRNEAYDEAYNIACEKYQSYEGLYGIPSYEECRDQAIEELERSNEPYTSEDVEYWTDEIYTEMVSHWIDYWIEEVEED